MSLLRLFRGGRSGCNVSLFIRAHLPGSARSIVFQPTRSMDDGAMPSACDTISTLQHNELVWQQVAGLSVHQAAQILGREPQLIPFLQAGFSSSTFASNMHLLRSFGYGAGSDLPPKLRGYMALAPPHKLQQALAGRVIQQLPHAQSGAAAMMQLASHFQAVFTQQAGHEHPAEQQQLPLPRLPRVSVQSQSGSTLQLQQLLHTHVFQLTTCLQQQQQQQQQQPSPQGQQPTTQQHQRDPPFYELALAITRALGLAAEEAALQHQAAPKAACSSSSWSPLTAGASGSGSSSSRHDPPPARAYSTFSDGTHDSAAGLAAALARTARSVSLRRKPQLGPHAAVLLVQQLQQASGMSGAEVLDLLVKRPAALWQQGTHQPLPGPMLQQIQRQLQPHLSQQHLKQLLQRAPVLLSCTEAQVAGVLSLLLGPLALSREQAAHTLLRHPRLLAAPVQGLSLNLGFLVGLGLTPAQLAAMVAASPQWMSTPLRELTSQWHFITTVAKASLSDVVLFPGLLSLPISTRLGPRITYARKRQIKLLLPSHAAQLPALPPQQWLKHKVVPLQFWLSTSDRKMCVAMGLNLEDYTRFKAAWVRVDAVKWKRCDLADRSRSRRVAGRQGQ